MSSHAGGRDLQAELLVVVCVILWAANYSVSKFAIGRLDPLVFNALRYLVAAACLWGFFSAAGRWTPVSRADRPHLFRAGFIANFVYQITFIIGLTLTSAGNAAILLATAPLWTVVIHARVSRKAIPDAVWFAMALSLAGIAMIVLGSGKRVEFGSSAMVGDGICLVAAVLWAVTTNLQKPLLGRYSPLQVALVMVTIGAVGLTAVALPFTGRVDWRGVEWPFFAAAAASGALSIAAGNVLWAIGVKRLGPDETANFGNLIPVVAFVISYGILGERFEMLQVVGACVTVAGVWLARRAARKRST